jgi:hypothetical protein
MVLSNQCALYSLLVSNKILDSIDSFDSIHSPTTQDDNTNTGNHSKSGFGAVRRGKDELQSCMFLS